MTITPTTEELDRLEGNVADADARRAVPRITIAELFELIEAARALPEAIARAERLNDENARLDREIETIRATVIAEFSTERDRYEARATAAEAEVARLREAVVAETEACARIADDPPSITGRGLWCVATGNRIALAIRSRINPALMPDAAIRSRTENPDER